MSDNLRQELENRLNQKSEEFGKARKDFAKYAEAYELLRTELANFVNGTPIRVVSNAEHRIEHYGEVRLLKNLELTTEAALFRYAPEIMLGGNQPLASRYMIRIAATRLSAPLGQGFVQYDPDHLKWFVPEGMTQDRDGVVKWRGTQVDLVVFKRALIDALA